MLEKILNLFKKIPLYFILLCLTVRDLQPKRITRAPGAVAVAQKMMLIRGISASLQIQILHENRH